MKKALVLLLAQCSVASSAWASLDIVTHDANLSQGPGTTTFSITFNQPLDLSSFDESNRAAAQFQVFVYGNETLDYPDFYSAIFRTAEDASTGQNVVARAASPRNETEAEDPLSGGWGRVLAIAPITTEGNTVSFTLANQSFNLFGNEAFKYHIEAYEFGSLTAATSPRFATVTPVPESGTSLQFVLGGAFMAAALKRVKGQRPSRASVSPQ